MAAEHCGRQPAAVSRSSRAIASSSERSAKRSIPPDRATCPHEPPATALARLKRAEKHGGGRLRLVATRIRDMAPLVSLASSAAKK